MKKLIAFLLCFTLLAVGVTYGCIRYALRTPAEEPAIEQGIDLNGVYDENDLIITEVKETVGTANVTYPQIDGLKNRDVQEAVNADIRAHVEELKRSYENLGTSLSFLSCNVHGSFANVLSLGLFSGDDAQHYEQVYLNYNLNDGSRLRLEDLFTGDADLQTIVRTAFYEALTRGNLTSEYWKETQSPDEQELYKTVKGYLEDAERRFAFTPGEIYLYYNGYAATVPMTDFAEDIVIYTKYLTEESLFVEDGIGYDGVFTCAVFPQGFEEREFGFPEENFWYDVAVMEQYVDDAVPADVKERFLGFYNRYYANMLYEVETVRELAKANPDKGYILLACPFINLYVDWDGAALTVSSAATVNDNFRLYEMSRDLYETKYLPALIEEYRPLNYYLFYSGIDEYLDGDEVQLTKRSGEALYNYETGELLTLADCFTEGYDYAAAIRAQVKYDLMGYYGFSAEEAELQAQGAWFTLAGGGVQVNIPAWGDTQSIWMSLSDFPDSALAIFE